jgi:oxygen-independent coproporphyrinogen-3 oxidase
MRRRVSVYVHVPFCTARCPYCDFATAPATSPLRSRYIVALAAEIRARGAALGKPIVRTLYFGGGTPSLLEPAEFAALVDALQDAFDLRAVEVTLEANPGTLAAGRVAAFLAGGVTRISLGAQSLDPAGLHALARTHSVRDVANAVAELRAARVRNINLDLIFGWPGQTREGWRADLGRAVALGPDHLSCYPLTLELEPEEAVANWPGGGWRVLERWRRRASIAQPDDDELADMYADAERILAGAGFRHYEIANWAKPGYRSKHNLVYWRDGDWLGVGAGAHSHLDGYRSANPARLQPYVDRWDGTASATTNDFPVPAEPWETACLALRTSDGLNFAAYARRYGDAAVQRIVAALREVDGTGMLRWRRDSVGLSRRGRLLSNEVFARLVPEPVK